jgi:hypothetical protein
VTDFGAALNAEVVGHRLDDGRWECECGEVVPDDLTLYMHRRAVHAGGQEEKERP